MRRSLALITCLLLVGCGGDERKAERQRTIYVSLPLQGGLRANAVDAVRGARMALGDRKIRLVVLDDSLASTGNWDAGRVSANARRAIRDPSAIAYIGEANSGATAVSLPITNEAGLLQVSPGSTYGGLTRDDDVGPGEPGKYYPTGKRTFGRIIPADHIQAAAVVDYMKASRVRSLHVLHDRDTYGRGLASGVQRRAKEAGIAVTSLGGIDVRAANYRALGERVRRAGVDAVFFGGSVQTNAAQLTKDLVAADPGLLVFAPDAVAQDSYAKELGRRAERQVRLTLPVLPPPALPESGRAFLTRFEREHGAPPQPFAIYGYEAMSVILDALDRAGPDADRAAVVRSFFATKDRASVMGRYSIDASGDTTLKGYSGFRAKDGALAFDRTLSG